MYVALFVKAAIISPQILEICSLFSSRLLFMVLLALLLIRGQRSTHYSPKLKYSFIQEVRKTATFVYVSFIYAKGLMIYDLLVFCILN